MLRSLLLALAAAAAPLLAAPPAARAQAVSRDVRLIVPFAPGGTVDLLGRILAEGLAPAMGGRSIVVENRSGTGTFIAMQAVAQAPADGHTLSLASGAVLATAPVLPGMAMPIDPDKALAPVTNLIRVPILLVGRPQAPFRDLPGLIAFAKAHPGRLNIGQSGAGSLTHLLAARLGHEAGISMVQIQYRGGTPALLDVMAGTADLYFSLLPESLPHIRDAKLRPIAFASPERNPNLPEVSLVSDVLPGFVGDTAYGLVVAAGTPPEWIAFWNAAVNGFMNRPEVRERMKALLWVPVNGSPEAYRGEIARDRETWGGVIRAAGIRSGS
jgi:tripartite-type tricarboxylate transporter receptor subunit TctC